MDVVVIGGGVLGLTQAYELAKRGARVHVIDARAGGLGASAVNAGWVVPADAAPVPGPGLILKSLKWMARKDSPLYIKPSVDPAHIRFMFQMWRRCNLRDFRAGFQANLALAEGTMDLLDEYARDGIDGEFHSDGLLMAYLDAEDLHALAHDMDLPKAFGLEPQLLVGREAQQVEPLLVDTIAGALFLPHERHLDPEALVLGLHKRCEELGVQFTDNAPIDRVERINDSIVAVRSGDRRFAADAFIVAAGAWTGRVTALFGVPLPIRPGKGYSVDMTPPPLTLRTMLNLSDARVAMTPLHGKLRAAGTMEFAGMDEKVSAVRAEAIVRAPGAYLQGWQAPMEALHHARAGMRPMTPDSLPVIGPLGDLTNAYVSSGHGMLGVTLGPATSAALAQLVVEGRMSPRLLPFAPSRFR